MERRVLKKILGLSTAQRQEERRAELYRNFIRHEAKVGGKLFGPTNPSVRREFFCLDQKTWVWHEEWTDVNGQPHVQTTRYDVRPNGILKSQHGKYLHVGPEETLRLCAAAKIYREAIRREVYSFVR